MFYEDQAMNDIASFEEFIGLSEMQQLITESSILINEGMNIVKLNEANKGFASRIGEALKKLMEKIKEIFDKFIYNVKTLLSTNKKWLQDNVTIINKMKATNNISFNIYDYFSNESRLENFKIETIIPSRNVEKDMITEKTEFRKKYLSNYLGNDKNTDLLGEGLKDHFRGSEEKTMKGTSINPHIRNMYSYCVNYDKKVDALQKEYKALKTTVDRITAELGRYKDPNPEPTKEESQKTEPQTSNKPKPPKVQDRTVSESLSDIYIKVEDKCFSEMTLMDIEDFNVALSEFNTMLSEVEVKSTVTDNDSEAKVVVPGGDASVSGSNSTTEEKKMQAYRLYVNEYYYVMSIKMTVMEAKYKDYIKVLKALVKETK